MKKHFLVLSIFLLLFSFSRAQFAFIPDTNFRNFLVNNGFAACMQGDSLDTTCTAVVTSTNVNCGNKNIYDVQGIQYFDNLQIFSCFANYLTMLPTLPNSIQSLFCGQNQLTVLPTLPIGLTFLDCSQNQLLSLPSLPLPLVTLHCFNNQLSSISSLPPGLEYLWCGGNVLTSLPPLPSTLIELNCNTNQITSWPSLPVSLQKFYCYYNQVSILPQLPVSLIELGCGDNQLTSLPLNLPTTLQELRCESNNISVLPILPTSLHLIKCDHNQLTYLPTLPLSLHDLFCDENALTSLPTLPTTLSSLNCGYNQLTSLPPLPDTLRDLSCYTNQLTVIPTLPHYLFQLDCQSNQLSVLPALPNTISSLYCQYNQLTSLPELPDSIGDLRIDYNPIACLPAIKKIGTLTWSYTSITCLPNIGRIYISVPLIDTLPLCDPFAPCPLFWNISGKVFFDADSSCTQDTNEISLKNISVILDSGGVQLQQMLTDNYGRYSFQTGYGNYELIVDTTNAPYVVNCPVTFTQPSVLTSVDSMDTGIDFGLQCKAGYDLIAKSISPSAMFRAGVQRTFYFDVSDAMSFYGTSCASGISGSVQAILSNLLSYISPAAGAIAPTSINGDTITWSISDFSLVDPVHDFNIVVQISTSATINDSVCVQLNVFPIVGDNIPANNSLSECYPVRAAVDPNEKYMSPSGAVDSSAQWFTFTIFFQNTGNAPAQNIYILDTLDQNLDATTFSYLSSSNDVVTQLLPGNILRFNYPNINLIDSTTNEPGSHGYVQFKIKRKENLPLNTTISNTGYIYFDFNAALATNTVSATFYSAVGVTENSAADFYLYPNPTQNKLAVCNRQLAIKAITIFNVLGVEILAVKPEASSKRQEAVIDVSDLSSGIYFLKIQTEKASVIKKFVKQ